MEAIRKAILGDRLTRRSFLRATGMSGAALSLGAILAACKSSSGEEGTTGATGASAGAVKIGFVSPKTGPLAPFGEADDFVIGALQDQLNGLTIAGQDAGHPDHREGQPIRSQPCGPGRIGSDHERQRRSHACGIDTRDDEPRVGSVRSERCAVHLDGGAVAAVVPGQQQDPANPVPFKFAYHFFWGLEDIEQVFLDMWNTIDTNKKVAGLFPNDGDGNAWGDPDVGFPAFFGPNGYTIVDPGRYEDGTQDFSAQISAFKKANAQILTGVPIPPDFTNFWTQANQQGFVPKIASVGKALLFPSSVEALGDIGEGCPRSTGGDRRTRSARRSPIRRRRSSRTRTRRPRSRQWTQPIGFVHALFEVAVDVLQRSSDVTPDAIVEAIAATNSEHDRRDHPVDRAAVPERREDQARRGAVEDGHRLPVRAHCREQQRAAGRAGRGNTRSDPRIVNRQIRIEPDGTW